MLKPPRRILDDLNHDDLVGGDGGPGVGAWQTFTVDPGWTPSTLRFRTVPAGLQFDGAAVGSTGGGLARLGVLPIGYRPARQQVAMCAVISGVSYIWGFVVFQPTGEVFTWWSAAGTQLVVSVIIALD